MVAPVLQEGCVILLKVSAHAKQWMAKHILEILVNVSIFDHEFVYFPKTIPF